MRKPDDEPNQDDIILTWFPSSWQVRMVASDSHQDDLLFMMLHEYSCCIMSALDASWVLIMSAHALVNHEDSCCIMSAHDASWDRYSSCIMSTHDASWVFMRHHEYSWGILNSKSSWWLSEAIFLTCQDDGHHVRMISSWFGPSSCLRMNLLGVIH